MLRAPKPYSPTRMLASKYLLEWKSLLWRVWLAQEKMPKDIDDFPRKWLLWVEWYPPKRYVKVSYGLNYVSPKLTGWNYNPQCLEIGAFKEAIKFKEVIVWGPDLIGLVSSYEREKEGSLSLHVPTEERPCYKPRGLTRNQSWQHLDPGLPASITVSKWFCCLSHLVCGISLGQHKQINTES